MNYIHVKTGDTVVMLSGKDKGKQGKDHGKGDEIHHSSDYHSLYIVHSTGQIRMIATEKIYRNVIADHIIGSHK